MRLIVAQYEKQQNEESYRIYTSDTLLYICESVAKTLGGRCMENRYADFIIEKPEQTESGDEIIDRISEKLNAMRG